MNRIRRAWHRALQHAHLRQPATPHIRLWDKGMQPIATLQHAQPGHYTWPSREWWTAVHGTWSLTQDELDIIGLQPGDQLGPGIVGQPRDVC